MCLCVLVVTVMGVLLASAVWGQGDEGPSTLCEEDSSCQHPPSASSEERLAPGSPSYSWGRTGRCHTEPPCWSVPHATAILPAVLVCWCCLYGNSNTRGLFRSLQRCGRTVPGRSQTYGLSESLCGTATTWPLPVDRLPPAAAVHVRPHPRPSSWS